MNVEKIEALRQETLKAIESAEDPKGLEAVRVKYLGRKGPVVEIMQSIKNVPPEDRAVIGKGANALKKELSAALKAKQAALSSGPAAKKPKLDISLPGRWLRMGSKHPISHVIDEATRIFNRIGFSVAEGPDVEKRFNNFEALNTAAHHPSLDETDTFWLSDGSLLRTQTSPVQIRVMQANEPPVRIITPGRCYRRDTTDATHSANFHQIEGLYVDTETVSLADLKGTMAYFAAEMMGPNVGVRFRPHFFPFTEPSVEVDFSCHVCGGTGCRVCKHSGWIEIAGAGMVDPRVYERIGYDPDAVNGFAFGMGVERIAMIKYGIPDIRWLYENDVRFLTQFS